jgi:hypothetical protein
MTGRRSRSQPKQFYVASKRMGLRQLCVIVTESGMPSRTLTHSSTDAAGSSIGSEFMCGRAGSRAKNFSARKHVELFAGQLFPRHHNSNSTV